jgi:hypothetical protein
MQSCVNSYEPFQPGRWVESYNNDCPHGSFMQYPAASREDGAPQDSKGGFQVLKKLPTFLTSPFKKRG